MGVAFSGRERRSPLGVNTWMRWKLSSPLRLATSSRLSRASWCSSTMRRRKEVWLISCLLAMRPSL